MRKQHFRAFFLSLALMLALSLTGAFTTRAQAAAASGTCGEEATWVLEDGVLTISGKGAIADYSYNYTDGRDAAPWYAYRGEITKVIIQDGITGIGNYAFYNFYGEVTSISLPKSLTSIGGYAFCGCRGLTSIWIPNHVTVIGNYAFADCTGLTGIDIPDSVISIGKGAFSGCYIMVKLSIGTGVTSIGSSAFAHCSIASVSIPGNVVSIGSSAFYKCESLTYVSVADGVASIGDYAFAECKYLARITLPDTVTAIGAHAFESCYKLTSMVIPNGITTICDYTFSGCSAMEKVIIPDGVVNIGQYAFNYCIGIPSITIPDSVKRIYAYAFNNCENLTDVYYGDSEENWGKITISNGNDYLTQANLHTNSNQSEDITYSDIIGSGTYGDNLTWTVSTSGVLTITGTGAMAACSEVPWFAYRYLVTNAVIGDGITTIADNLFRTYHPNLTSVTIPDSVQTIGQGAFYSCSKLTDITIPNSVTSIGIYAFLGCRSLTDFTIPNSVTTLSPDLFYNCTGFTSFTIPASITSVGYRAFYSCTNLREVTIPASVTSIGDGAFQFCTSLTDVYYDGTEEDWKAITISQNNECLTGATIHYSSVPLAISKQPTTQIVKEGTSVKFSVTASGSGLKYQWQYRTSSTGSWKNSGASTAKKATVKLNATTGKNGYQYRCKITDSVGNVVYSEPATLYVLGIKTQPGDAEVSEGATAKFKVKATGDGLTYQWQYRTSETGKWKNSTAASAVTATVKVTGKASRNGYQYRCKITDSAGNVVYSDPATLTVLSAVSVTSQPSDACITVGETAKFKVKATGDGLVYQWQYRTSSTGSWKDSSAASAVTATVKVTGKTSRNGYQYRCKVTDSAGNVVYSEPATLYVLGVKTQPSSQTVSAGTSVKFTVKATGDGLTYQWQYRTSSSGSWKNSGASTATKATIKINGTTSKNGYQYRCKITDSAGNVIYSDPATLTVN